MGAFLGYNFHKGTKGKISMSMIGKFFGLPVMAAIFCLVGMMGNAFAVIVDGVEYPFSLTTGSTNFFNFNLSAKGTFYVDCGTGGTLSVTTGVSGGTITRQSSIEELYFCSYPDKAPRTISFGGTAIGYNTSGSAAISFNAGFGSTEKLANLRKITSISGDLSAIFPYMTENPANGEQPKFYHTFSFTDNLTVIPSTLFSGYTTGASGMFYATFWYSKGISSIPSNLFANITTGASNTFNKTFYGCTGLSGYMPSTLFSGLIANGSPYATGMMGDMFANTGLATECPAGTTQYITGYEQYWNGKVSCQPSSGETTGQGDTHEYPFSLTTTNLNANDNFQFDLSAKGTFYVDCGANGTLSGDGVSGGTITKDNVGNKTYTCTYTTGGHKTIQFGGTATGYLTQGAAIGAISFEPSCLKVASIHGNLSDIFTNPGYAVFSYTFKGCKNLTAIPNTLFSGYTSGGYFMFYETFRGCTGLTSIPANLFFPNATSVSGAYDMFSDTFSGCTGLTSIPANLFSKITSGAKYMFKYTFYGCSNLTGFIPPTLFDGLIENNAATNTFNGTFGYTGMSTSCPSGTTQYASNYTSAWGGKVSCQPSSGGITGQDDPDPTTYTITYKTGNCEGNISVVATTDTATDGVAYSLSPNANTYMNNHIKTGYSFVGWNTATNQQNANVGANWTPTADTTLYAACAPKKYTVTYKVGSHVASGVVDFPDTNGATYDANYSALTGGTSGSQTGIYPADGWTFAGWSTDANPTFNGDVLNNQFTGANPWHMDSNLTVYAAYKQIPPTAVCTVTYNCNGVITTVPYYTSPFSVNSGCNALAGGQTFTHWIDDNGGEIDAGATYSCNGATAILTGQYTEIDNPDAPVDPDPIITPVGPGTNVTTVACAAGKYLPKNGTVSTDCVNCESGYFCPRDGNYASGSSVAQGRYACLPGGVQNGDRKSCRVVLDKSQLLYGLSSGEECWQKTNMDDYVECMLRDVHRVE